MKRKAFMPHKPPCTEHIHAAMKRDGWKLCLRCGVKLFAETGKEGKKKG